MLISVFWHGTSQLYHVYSYDIIVINTRTRLCIISVSVYFSLALLRICHCHWNSIRGLFHTLHFTLETHKDALQFLKLAYRFQIVHWQTRLIYHMWSLPLHHPTVHPLKSSHPNTGETLSDLFWLLLSKCSIWMLLKLAPSFFYRHYFLFCFLVAPRLLKPTGMDVNFVINIRM